MTDSALQRLNMVESQIRPSDITDRRILRAMLALPRENFVPAGLTSLAYMDEVVPLFDPAERKPGPVRSMMSPRTLAKLVQLAQIDAAGRVLDVGAGRGYGAALIAQMAANVVALECDETLVAKSKTLLASAANITVVAGGLAAGFPQNGPYDVIVLEGSVFESPGTLLEQLKPGGRLVGILNDGAMGQATVWSRQGNHYGSNTAFEASIGPLPGFERAIAFAF